MKNINANKYSNTIEVPASKSYLQRAIAIASFVKGQSIIEGYYASDDANVALGIAQALGVETKLDDSRLVIEGGLFTNDKLTIHVGEAGLSTRMFAPVLAGFGLNVVMNGEGSILLRPQHLIVHALKELGVHVKSDDGYLPISFHGGFQQTNLTIDGSMSSQLLTGLLIAFSVSTSGGTIHVEDLKSKPYIDMTIQVLNDFGYQIQNNDYKLFSIAPNQIGVPQDYTVEGDWSGASFHVVAGAIGGKVTLTNLNPDSKQSDVLIVECVEKAGAKVSWRNEQLIIEKDDLDAFDVDLTEAPDLFPPVCVLALACHGISKIKGVSRLKHKESDRGVVLQKEFEKLGGRVELIGDEMWVHGNGRLKKGKIDSHNDHRIAMAAAIAALICDGEIGITNELAINKSYPTFYIDFESGLC